MVASKESAAFEASLIVKDQLVLCLSEARGTWVVINDLRHAGTSSGGSVCSVWQHQAMAPCLIPLYVHMSPSLVCGLRNVLEVLEVHAQCIIHLFDFSHPFLEFLDFIDSFSSTLLWQAFIHPCLHPAVELVFIQVRGS
jgi:hypothetical protein